MKREALVLVHGFAQNHRLFEKQIEHFRDKYMVH